MMEESGTETAPPEASSPTTAGAPAATITAASLGRSASYVTGFVCLCVCFEA